MKRVLVCRSSRTKVVGEANIYIRGKPESKRSWRPEQSIQPINCIKSSYRLYTPICISLLLSVNMKFSSAAVLSSLAFLSDFALAQTVQSKPFHLTIVSDNKTYNGMGLSTCHEGAAIESLCVAKTSAVYHLNTTKSQTAPIKGDSVSGVLTWVLPSSMFSTPAILGVRLKSCEYLPCTPRPSRV